jgi:alpha-L-fucosidase 2
MDMSIIRELFTNVINASEILDIDEDFRNQLTEKRKKLYPLRIGSKGQIQEWSEDFEETDPYHRHVSHLYGLYPAAEINPSTPEFFHAARKTLELRGDGGTGWSRGWKINWWARLLDGDHAYKLVRGLLNYTESSQGNVTGGGTYPNFFDAHPPFQIDGNFAGAAGMAEMLVQSQSGEIHLLPALPTAWKEGMVKGLRARGAFELDMNWKQNVLVNATIKSLVGNTCTIRTSRPISVKGSAAQSTVVRGYYVTSFKTEKNKVYYIETLEQTR